MITVKTANSMTEMIAAKLAYLRQERKRGTGKNEEDGGRERQEEEGVNETNVWGKNERE